MRLLTMAAGVVFWVSGVCGQGSLISQKVPNETGAWHAVRTSFETSSKGLSLRQEGGSGNGFLLPLAARQRQTVAVEADIRLRERLIKEGWSFAGVSLYQDDANYWMLALVEGPDGKRTVDFLENHGGVWQAQSEAKTFLKREGNVSFSWKGGTAYRLRLTLENGKVSALASDPVDGRELGAAWYTLGNSPAVRSGRPGLIAHGQSAECQGLTYCMRSPSGGRAIPGDAGTDRVSVALLDDALPGHDRAANAKVAEALESKGFEVTRLTADQLLTPQVLTADTFQILVVPQCDSVPSDLGAAVQQFTREGGHLIFLGGPFLDRALVKVGGKWLDPEGQHSLLQRVEAAHHSFEIKPGGDFTAWRRSSPNREAVSTLRVVDEGPSGAPCLRLDVSSFQGWDVFQSPDLPSLFGKGHDFFTFLAKGDSQSTQLAVEVIERDGSRWIATAPLTPEWWRVGLRLCDFLYWKDSASAKRRGHAGDRLQPVNAARLSVGFSSSHTPSAGAGAHTVWLAAVGSARDPLAEVKGGATEIVGSIECVYPRYKAYVIESGTIGIISETAGGSSTASIRCGRTVCPIPRTLGEGVSRNNRWRFVPLQWAVSKNEGARGVSEWMLLSNRFPVEGTVIAGFGYTDAAVWSSPKVLSRIVEVAGRITHGTVLESAGTDQFAYWPGEPVKVGARVRAFGTFSAESECVFEITHNGQVVWSERMKRSFPLGVTDLAFTWQPPAEPGVYSFSARMAGVDKIDHNFTVLDAKPAAKGAFIEAKAGDFWLSGKKWYPVGVNYWPLYVSGMDQPDYGSGWLRDAYYSPTLVERDLVQMRDMGINLVSIQTPPIGETRNLLHFLKLCKTYGIYANLYVGLASPLAFNDKELNAYLETARLPGNATVFAYDTIWEPGNHVFKDDAARGKWDGEWRAWINERYGSLANAEKDWGFKARRDPLGNVISPPDQFFREDGAWRVMMAAYRRFMDNLTSRLWGRSNRRLRELDPNHLVSFRQGNTLPHDFALSGPVKHIDFICPEGYAIRDTDEGEDAIGFITRYVDFTTGGKPIVWSEFGQSVWDNGRMAPDAGAVKRQGSYSERFYRTGFAAGANGTVPWWWVGGYRVDERSDFGIIEPGRTERPAARLIREYGPRLMTPREKPRPAVWFEFDRDAHAGGYCRAAFYEGAAAYRAAVKEGKMLGVRTAGTGADSASVPLVAVGNQPCSGTNPPKYLDSEFNFLQVRDAVGVWRDAEDGAEIAVKADQPVQARASLGNTQEATWLVSGEGCVALVARVDRAEVGRWPLGFNVVYLGDAEFGEFTLLPSVAGRKTVSVRLEAQGRTPFGEARVFTLREGAAGS